MLNCNGTVSEIRYCYFSDNPPASKVEIFTLLTLERAGMVFNVDSSVTVFNSSSAENCTMATEGYYCCESLELVSENQFRLPALNFAFGIVSGSSAQLVQFNQSQYSQYRAEHYQGRFVNGAVLWNAISNKIQAYIDPGFYCKSWDFTITTGMLTINILVLNRIRSRMLSHEIQV